MDTVLLGVQKNGSAVTNIVASQGSVTNTRPHLTDDGMDKPSYSVKTRYKTCAWCGRKLGSYIDYHHWLIKRSALPKAMYALINVAYNIIPLHHNCHIQHGNTRTMLKRAMGVASSSYGADNLIQWYNSVAQRTHLQKIERLEDLV